MERIEPKLPEWISRQASLEPNIKVDGENNLNTRFWYLLTMCCPLIFESYAIVLHPFWVNDEIKNQANKGLEVSEEDRKNGFKIVGWKDFFSLYNSEFNLSTALQTKENIRQQMVDPKWPEDIYFPEEGDLENGQLISLRNVIQDIYGDHDINNYYCFLKTHKWESDIIYKSKLSEIEQLWDKEDIRDNPTAIFPDSQEWCIVTDYDLEYTYIGGSNKLINKLVELRDIDIFPIEPKFIERGDNFKERLTKFLKLRKS